MTRSDSENPNGHILRSFAPLVAMRETAHARKRDNLPMCRPIRHRPWIRRVSRQGQVTAVLVVMLNAPTEKSAKVWLIKNNYVIQNFLAHAQHPSLSNPILPRKEWSRFDKRDVHGLQLEGHHVPVLSISIEYRKTRRAIEREGFSKLLNIPHCNGEFRNDELDEFPSLAMNDKENLEPPKRDCWHGD